MAVYKKGLSDEEWREAISPAIENAQTAIDILNKAYELGSLETATFAARDVVVAEYDFSAFKKQIDETPAPSSNEALKARKTLIASLKTYAIAMFMGLNLMQTINRVASSEKDELSKKDKKDITILKNAFYKNIKNGYKQWQSFENFYCNK